MIVHQDDAFTRIESVWSPPVDNYLLARVLRRMESRGHRWRLSRGLRAQRADAAILHVDRMHVGPDYVRLGERYRTAINFGTADISKRPVSGALPARQDDWAGPVIVKTDLNFAGRPEAWQNLRASRAGRLPLDPGLAPPADYVVLPTIGHVPPAVWDDPARVVERFIPEPDEHGYAMRTWVFMGTRDAARGASRPIRWSRRRRAFFGPRWTCQKRCVRSAGVSVSTTASSTSCCTTASPCCSTQTGHRARRRAGRTSWQRGPTCWRTGWNE